MVMCWTARSGGDALTLSCFCGFFMIARQT
jgi:hypothetical protein